MRRSETSRLFRQKTLITRQKLHLVLVVLLTVKQVKREWRETAEATGKYEEALNNAEHVRTCWVWRQRLHAGRGGGARRAKSKPSERQSSMNFLALDLRHFTLRCRLPFDRLQFGYLLFLRLFMNNRKIYSSFFLFRRTSKNLFWSAWFFFTRKHDTKLVSKVVLEVYQACVRVYLFFSCWITGKYCKIK